MKLVHHSYCLTSDLHGIRVSRAWHKQSIHLSGATHWKSASGCSCLCCVRKKQSAFDAGKLIFRSGPRKPVIPTGHWFPKLSSICVPSVSRISTLIHFWYLSHLPSDESQDVSPTREHHDIDMEPSSGPNRKLIVRADNVRPYTAKVTLDLMEHSAMKGAPHPPYSPDLAP
jgi:hypothetical protein